MTDEQGFDPDANVRNVMVDLLLKTLPPELRAAAPDLADGATECAHMNKPKSSHFNQ